VAVPTTLWLSARWQADIRHAVNMPAQGHYWYLGMFAIAVVMASGLVGLTRLFHDVYLVVMRRLLRYIPLLAAKLVASVLVTALVVGLFTGVVYRGLIDFASNPNSDPHNDAVGRSGHRHHGGLGGGRGLAAAIPPLAREAGQFVTQAPAILARLQTRQSVLGQLTNRLHLQQRLQQLWTPSPRRRPCSC
jgi:hypothetical protein